MISPFTNVFVVVGDQYHGGILVKMFVKKLVKLLLVDCVEKLEWLIEQKKFFIRQQAV